MGYRVSEAVEVLKSFEKFYDSITNTIKNVSGKGGNINALKSISSSLIAKMKKLFHKEDIKRYFSSLE